MNQTQCDVVGAEYQMYDEGACPNNNFDTQNHQQFRHGGFYYTNNPSTFQVYENFEKNGIQTPNQPQFGQGGFYYQNGHSVLQSQNLSVSAENFERNRIQTPNQPQLGQGGFYYHNGYPILQSQNLSVSAENFERNGIQTPNQPQFGQGGFYYQNGYPILQSQNLSVSAENFERNGIQTPNQPQFAQGGFYYHNGYPILQSQNLSVTNYHSQGYQYQNHNQFGHNGMHYNGGHQFPYGNNYAGESYSQRGHDNSDQNRVSSDRRNDNSSSIKYQMLSGPSELECNIHHKDRRHLVNYLKFLHEGSMSADQIDEFDVNPTDDWVNHSNVSLDVAPDVNVGERDPNVTTDNQSIEFDINATLGKGMEHDENKQNVVAESLILKPKYKTGCDNRSMFVKTSDCKSPKKLCCPFCEKLFAKLARHLEVKHKTEPDVQRFLNHPKGSKERRRIQDSLRKIGMTNWNKNIGLNKNEMITNRRPNAMYGNEGIRFKICPFCNGSYTKASLRLHIKYKCQEKPVEHEEKSKGVRVITALATSIEARYLESASAALQKVYKRFRDDALVRSLKFDWLITVYGNKLAARNTKQKSPDMIRGRLRVIARFLCELKRIEPEITDLATMYHPKHFDKAVEAIQAMARFDADNNEYGAPSTASSCVTAIKQIGVMLIAEYIKRDDQEHQRLTQNFLTVMNTDIHYMINKTVNENQSNMRRLKVVTLPTLDDIKLLNQFLESESNECFNDLSKSFDYDKWLYLSKLTMISILVYNRKRVGDTENITIEYFKCKETINESTNQQLFESLSNEAKEVARRYSRMRVRGKKDRTVPVLLNQSMEERLKLIIFHRKAAGIPDKNPYLFAIRPDAIDEIKVVNAGIALKKFVHNSGAENPSSVTATNLRKQLATMCVSLKLDDTEVADVADFMGHAELVHRNHYRQNTLDRQVVKMSQWLEVASGNVTPVDVERTSTIESREKAMVLLRSLLAALGAEDCTHDNNDVPAAETSNIPIKPTRKSVLRKSIPKKPAPVRKSVLRKSIPKKPAPARKTVSLKPTPARKSVSVKRKSRLTK